MSHERIKSKIFLARKGIPKSENVTLSVFFYICMLASNDIE